MLGKRGQLLTLVVASLSEAGKRCAISVGLGFLFLRSHRVQWSGARAVEPGPLGVCPASIAHQLWAPGKDYLTFACLFPRLQKWR